MAHPVPTRCPVCSEALEVQRLGCVACGSALEGHFEAGWPSKLTSAQLAFVRVFLVCRGKIKDVEAAVGLSYPTVVARLDEVVGALGESRSAPAPTRDRLEVLDALARGELTVDEAERRLREAQP
jgi:hypothetical protein